MSMLTTMFYYNHYKPYIFKAGQKEKISQVKPQVAANKQINQERRTRQFLLNKTFNQNVLKYVQDISYNLVDLKDAAKYVKYDIDDFTYNSQKYGHQKAKDILKKGLSIFVDQFNKSYNFVSSQTHSESLFEFSYMLINAINQGESKLAYLGIMKNETGRLVFDEQFYNSLPMEELDIYITEGRSVFQNLYSDSRVILTKPLADHMNFKNLNYYYNYKYGGVVADTFRLIESGLIVDVAI